MEILDYILAAVDISHGERTDSSLGQYDLILNRFWKVQMWEFLLSVASNFVYFFIALASTISYVRFQCKASFYFELKMHGNTDFLHLIFFLNSHSYASKQLHSN